MNTIFLKAEGGVPLSKREIKCLLNIEAGQQTDWLFRTARNLRRRYFGNKIFLYGFIYASTYCRNDCRFCFYRRSNLSSNPYRKSRSEILSAVKKLAASGVHLIDLTMGEDPAFFSRSGNRFDRLVDLVASAKQLASLPIMVSPGVIPDEPLYRLKKAGATWYACYQETHNRQLFQKLRPYQDYSVRMNTKFDAHKQGLLVEEGLLCGVGESPDDIACSIEGIKHLEADQVRVMNFVPQSGTPMERRHPPPPEKELRIIALLRLIFPDRLIPASLDIDGIAGLKQRLAAGANVVTSIVPPGEGLAGVAQNSLDIEEGNRSTQAVLAVLKECGLESADTEDYLTWICSRQETLVHGLPAEGSTCD